MKNLIFIVILCVVFLILLVSAVQRKNVENYADQMAHAVVGGISGPLIDLYPNLSLEDRESFFFISGRKPFILTERFELVKRGIGLTDSEYFGKNRDFVERRDESFLSNSDCSTSLRCPYGYPRECPMGAKGCPYPCTS